MSAAKFRFGGEEVERPKEVPRCRRTLAHFFGVPNVSFKENVGGNGVVFELSGPANRPAEATGRLYTVLPFLQSNGVLYWVAVILSYVYELGVLDLRASSVVMFRGLAEATKEPLLRAEWEKLPAPHLHAQPHWHVYAASCAEQATTSADMATLHLAMAARWHLDDGGPEPHYTDPSGDNVVRWVGGCLSYLKEETAFLAKKRPAF